MINDDYRTYQNDATLTYSGTDTVYTDWIAIDWNGLPSDVSITGYESNFGIYDNIDNCNVRLTVEFADGQTQSNTLNYDWNSVWYEYKPLKYRLEIDGKNSESTGSVTLMFFYFCMYFTYYARKPNIEVLSQDRIKISSKSGCDKCIAVFRSDERLTQWEARATLEGQEVGHGVGILVEESTETLKGGAKKEVQIDDEELTSGDAEYIINIYGMNADGLWSDGSYEELNILDLADENVVYYYSNTSYLEGSVIFDTGTQNTDESSYAIKVQIIMDDWSYYEQLSNESTTGVKIINITKTASFDTIRIALNGNVTDAAFSINASAIMTDGDSYALTFNLEQISTNYAVIKDVTLVKVV